MAATKTALGTKPLRVLPDGTTLRINDDNKLEAIFPEVPGVAGPRGAFGGYAIKYAFTLVPAANKLSFNNGGDGTLFLAFLDLNGTDVSMPIEALEIDDRIKIYHIDQFDTKYAFLVLTSDWTAVADGLQFDYTMEGQRGTFADLDVIAACPEYKGPIGETGPVSVTPGPVGPTGPLNNRYTTSFSCPVGSPFTAPELSGSIVFMADTAELVLPNTVTSGYWIDVFFDNSMGGSAVVNTMDGQYFYYPFLLSTSVSASIPGASARFTYMGGNLWAVTFNSGFALP